ncbi:hypothetical protein ACFFRR_011181 [Megaselia abdita]
MTNCETVIVQIAQDSNSNSDYDAKQSLIATSHHLLAQAAAVQQAHSQIIPGIVHQVANGHTTVTLNPQSVVAATITTQQQQQQQQHQNHQHQPQSLLPTSNTLLLSNGTVNLTTNVGAIGAGPQKPFQCHVCERKFRQLSTLTNHVKIHTGEKPYKCSICEKKFRQSSTLTNHLKIHTGEKPFKCTYCLKLFRQLSTLTNHLKIHTGEKPFECAVCKKQFRQSSTLNNHIKIHVMDKLYFPAFEIKEEVEEEEG